ncbi:MAG: hypothetical protein ACT4P3_09370 [Betaproteobacteria bacterium]
MPAIPANERRRFRGALKVVHRHQVGGKLFRRVSELVYLQGKPVAVVRWIDIGGVRAPLYTCVLDEAKLHAEARGRYTYDGITVDPRFEEPPAPSAGPPAARPERSAASGRARRAPR